MALLEISDRFAAQCSPVIGSNYDTCGSVTRATIAHLTVSQLNALFTPGGLFADLDAWFINSIEMKACGIKTFALYDWIMANADRTQYKAALSGTKVVKGDSLMHPFIMAKQMSVVNRDHWKVTGGYAVSAYTPATTGPLTTAQKNLGTHPNDRVVRIASRHGVPLDANWFRERETIHVFNRSGGGITQHGQWRVLAAAAAADNTYVDVIVRSVNTASDEPFDAAPATGVMIPGVNNVQDWEQWCQNLPNIDPRKKVPFWLQTFRNSRCIDSEYRAVYERLYDSNPAFREFGDLPLAERNKQDELEFQKRFVNDFFFNKPLVDQTLDRWEYLEPIYTVGGAVIDPGLSGKLVGRRANWVGVMEQLRLCGRVKDLVNNPLNFYEFLDENYQIMRAREGDNNRTVTDIDWWTDSITRAQLMTSFLQYYKQEYLEMLRITIQAGQVNKDLGVVYDSYMVKRPGGVRINIMSHKYFDDYLDEFADQSMESAGRRLWCLDIGKPGVGSIYYAQIAANRKVYTTAQIEELARLDSTFRCVMKTISIEQSLYSETGTVVVECPLNSLVINGIGSAAPIMTGQSGDTEADRTNLY